MTIRAALQQSRLATYAVLFALLWLLLATYQVATSLEWAAVSAPTFTGLNVVGGLVGLVVMVVLAMLLVALYGELSEEEPGPEPWPPSE